MHDGQNEHHGLDEEDDGLGHPVRRLCVAVGREQGADALADDAAENATLGILERAEEHGALYRPVWLAHQRARIALLPPGIDEAHVLTTLLRYLRDEVYRHNRVSAPPARIRLRVAAHEGLTYLRDEAYVGDVLDTLAMLVREESFAARAGAAEVAVILTDRIYHDVVRGRENYDLRPGNFTGLETAYGMAWTYVAPPLVGPDTARGGEGGGEEGGRRGQVSIRTRGRLRIGEFAGRDDIRSARPHRLARDPGEPDVRIDAHEAEVDRFAGRDLIAGTDDE